MKDTLKQTLEQHRLSHVTRFSPEQVQLLLDNCDLGTDALAFELLAQAQAQAQVPVSDIKVGAIAIGGSGHWYLGANVEFADQPLSHTIHAEQAVVGYAALWDEQYLEKMFISHPPCGQCRQFLQELNQDALLLAWPEHYFMLSDLLPHAFGPDDLPQPHGLLTHPATRLTPKAAPSQDALTLLAWDQANASYAPYSRNYAGVALLLRDGKMCHGRYLENAGFNPSLGPLHLALSQLYLQGYQPSDIERAVLVEAEALICHAPHSAQLLASLCDVKLEQVTVLSEQSTFTANPNQQDEDDAS